MSNKMPRHFTEAEVRIVDVRPDFMMHCDNDPRIEILLEPAADSISDGINWYDETASWERKDDIWFRKFGPLVHFFYHTGDNEDAHMCRGFGGWTRDVVLMDGTKHHIVGGWSSNSHAASQAIGEPVVHCSYTFEKDAWKRGHTFMSGDILLDNLTRWMCHKELSWDLIIQITNYGNWIVPAPTKMVKHRSGNIQVPARWSGYGLKDGLDSDLAARKKVLEAWRMHFIDDAKKYLCDPRSGREDALSSDQSKVVRL